VPRDPRELGAIFAGGALGAVLRALVARWLHHDPGAWPWSTMFVNLAGAALLGWLATRLQERLPLSAYRRPFLGTGICGGLTTFSTMQVEIVQMLDAGEPGRAIAYAAVSLVLGLFALQAGTALARRARWAT
jgi:CrcB protein